jgi:hypothetical protein
MYVNTKNIAVETTVGIRGSGAEGEMDVVVGVNSIYLIYLIHFKNLFKCHNVPP